MKNTKEQQRKRRSYRIRKKITGIASSPRMSVYRSLTALYVQLIDDTEGKTLLSASTSSKAFLDKMGVKAVKKNIETATLLGKYVGELAKEQKIEKVVFDRNGYKYHGKVKAIADGAREAGLNF